MAGPAPSPENGEIIYDADGHPVFLIGLTMAGAVSAGAYTAGVLDYLFRAMAAHNAWVDAERGKDSDAAPRHKVAIKAISGASAGGMCAGLAVASLIKAMSSNNRDLEPTRSFAYDANNNTATASTKATCELALEPLYDAWVTNIRLWGCRQFRVCRGRFPRFTGSGRGQTGSRNAGGHSSIEPGGPPCKFRPQQFSSR